jgi:acetyl esterase/lipase
MPSSHRSARGGSRPSRRAVMLAGLGLVIAGGAAGFELVQDGTLPGKYALARLDGACGSGPPTPHGAPPIRREATFQSAYRGRAVTMVTLIPARVATTRGLGVVIGLHGSGATARDFASQLSPAMTAAGITSVAAVTVDGGDTYWHKRADDDDPLGMIIHEVLPRLATAGLATARIGITGESMGGYGALLLAEQLAGERPQPAAVAAVSPAIFASYADAIAANRTSFDAPADFMRNDVVANAAVLREVPSWIGCGTDDPFEPQATRLRDRLAAITGHQPAGGILAGCHDEAFWERNLPAALTFLAAKTKRDA